MRVQYLVSLRSAARPYKEPELPRVVCHTLHQGFFRKIFGNFRWKASWWQCAPVTPSAPFSTSLCGLRQLSALCGALLGGRFRRLPRHAFVLWLRCGGHTTSTPAVVGGAPLSVSYLRRGSFFSAAGAKSFKIGRRTTKIVRAPALAVPTLKKKRLSSSSFFSFFPLFFFSSSLLLLLLLLFPSSFLALGCILRAARIAAHTRI